MNSFFYIINFWALALTSFAQKEGKQIGLILLPNQVFQVEDGIKILNDSLSKISQYDFDNQLNKFYLNKYNFNKYPNLSISQAECNKFKKVIIDNENDYLVKDKLSDSLLLIINNSKEEEVMFLLMAGKESDITSSKSKDNQQLYKGVGSVLGTIAGSLITRSVFIVSTPSNTVTTVQQSTSLYCLIFDKKERKYIIQKVLQQKVLH